LPSAHCFAERSLFCRALSLYTKPTSPGFYCSIYAPRRRALSLYTKVIPPSFYCFTRTPRRRAFTVSHAPHVAELLPFRTHPTSPSLYCSIYAPRRRAFTVSHAPHVAEPLLFHICPTSPGFFCFTRTPHRRAKHHNRPDNHLRHVVKLNVGNHDIHFVNVKKFVLGIFLFKPKKAGVRFNFFGY